VIAAALKLSVYFGESLAAGPDLASDALMASLARHDLAASALLRGIEGYGINRRIHAERFPDVSTDLPLLAMAVGPRDRVLATLADVDAAVPRGLVTFETATIATGADVAGATFPDGPGRAVKLTIWCRSGDRGRGRVPAYREAVALLRDAGASGAIVLRGVDGSVGGRRARARLFSTNGDVPVVMSSVPCFPTSSEPTLSAMPIISAALIVTALSASSSGSPNATATPASHGNRLL